MSPWASRLTPQIFSLLGGEPTIHSQLTDFILLARRYWPRSHLRIVTNGFSVHRHPSLPEILRSDPNANLYLSIHHESKEYLDKLRPNLELLKQWIRTYGIKIVLCRSTRYWERTYKGFGAAMEPFDDQQPQQSWEQCRSRFCSQLFEGHIWKCPSLAYLKMQNARYGLSDKWQHYLDYTPLSPECSDEELNAFFDRKAESYCGMCPAKPEKFRLPLPLPVSRSRLHSKV